MRKLDAFNPDTPTKKDKNALKIGVIGDTFSGKTSFIHALVDMDVNAGTLFLHHNDRTIIPVEYIVCTSDDPRCYKPVIDWNPYTIYGEANDTIKYFNDLVSNDEAFRLMGFDYIERAWDIDDQLDRFTKTATCNKIFWLCCRECMARYVNGVSVMVKASPIFAAVMKKHGISTIKFQDTRGIGNYPRTYGPLWEYYINYTYTDKTLARNSNRDAVCDLDAALFFGYYSEPAVWSHDIFFQRLRGTELPIFLLGREGFPGSDGRYDVPMGVEDIDGLEEAYGVAQFLAHAGALYWNDVPEFGFIMSSGMTHEECLFKLPHCQYFYDRKDLAQYEEYCECVSSIVGSILEQLV